MAESDAGFGEVVRRHLNIHFVANADANKVFPHFAGNMREDLVSVREGNTEHCAG